MRGQLIIDESGPAFIYALPYAYFETFFTGLLIPTDETVARWFLAQMWLAGYEPPAHLQSKLWFGRGTA